MPSPRRTLTVAEARRAVASTAFPPAPARGNVGVEAEWLTWQPWRPTARQLPTTLDAALADDALPAASAVSFEPGGQLELSTAPVRGPEAACTALAADLAVARRSLARRGVALVGLGLDPLRPPIRVLDAPRYQAMSAYFDAQGSVGRSMMCNTASLQVCLDLGVDELAARWQLAHALGPPMLAAFANSPRDHRGPTGWRSSRMAVWLALDRTRTAPVTDGRTRTATEAAAAWADYALAARVMLIRADERRFVPLFRPLPFAQWLAEGHELGWPTLDDLTYHLSTLFPPVRPRGWLELRYIDALPDPWWQVPVAVLACLLDHRGAAAAAERTCWHTAGLWSRAARRGLADPVVAAAAQRCFAIALEALPDVPGGSACVPLVDAYRMCFVDRCRSPADDAVQRRRQRPGVNFAATPTGVARP